VLLYGGQGSRSHNTFVVAMLPAAKLQRAGRHKAAATGGMRDPACLHHSKKAQNILLAASHSSSGVSEPNL